jgi:hypothetical protein
MRPRRGGAGSRNLGRFRIKVDCEKRSHDRGSLKHRSRYPILGSRSDQFGPCHERAAGEGE